MNKPRITSFIRNNEDEITKGSIKDTVKRLGDSGYVALPKELIKRYVEIKLRVLEDEK